MKVHTCDILFDFITTNIDPALMDDVKLLQHALLRLYSTSLKPDCVFSKQTESVVKEFQEDLGLPVTGVVTESCGQSCLGK